MNNKIKSVLFVCTGNSCRSVMAEGLLKKRLLELGKDDVKVSSAGTIGLDGLPPMEETIDTLKAQGIAMDDFRSRSVTVEMIKRSDLILAMEDLHKDEILRMAPEAAGKTFLLKEFGQPGAGNDREGSGVPDPIGRQIEFYKHVLNMIKKEVRRIAELL
ncbi:MAG: low molecular weight protein arginine phosphatase [Candidatus Omnitrophota bacterium]|nr:low molecular weight protein arginine phosphatase [Candidatus Omnitrophota bacterium]